MTLLFHQTEYDKFVSDEVDGLTVHEHHLAVNGTTT